MAPLSYLDSLMSVLVSVKLVHWTTNLLLDLSAPFPVSVSGCAVLMVVLSAQNLIFDEVFAVLLTLVFDPLRAGIAGSYARKETATKTNAGRP